jgi:phosphohistidine phosphatase SixA
MRLLRWFALAVTLATIVRVAPAAPAVILIVRHAEKEALPADDPPLTAGGRQRAEELARVVSAWSAAGAPVRALFASEVKRTRQTLEPLAAATGLTVSVVGAKDTAALVQRILAVDGGIVVIAGHSNTVPAIVEALGGPAGIAIADAEFDRLFAVTIAGRKTAVVALRYGAH